MRRLFTSWIALSAVLGVIVLGGFVIVQQIQHKVASRVEQGAVEAARILSSLVVMGNVVADSSVRARLTDEQVRDMDADIAGVIKEKRLEGLLVWRADGTLLYADRGQVPGAATMPADTLARATRGEAWLEREVSGRSVPTLVVFLPFDADHDGVVDGTVQVLTPDSRIVDEVHRAAIVLRSLAGLLACVLVGCAIAFRRRLVAREYAAMHDSLSGLANRAALRRETERALAEAGTGPGRVAALLVLDLDGFKAVNDTLGHPAGDALLVQVARSLAASVRPGDVVARLGGDEFAVLLTALPDRARAEVAAGQVLSRLRADSFQVDGIDLSVDASIGIAILVEHGDTVDLLLQRGDVAMYQAKRANAGVAIYDPVKDPHDVSQLGLLVELRRAIANDELVLHFQPKLGLSTGDLHGVEALVRWQHPTRGLLGPMEFIPLAENTGLMGPLTDWVLRHAIAQAARWRDSGLMIPVAVNIGRRSLIDQDLPVAVLTLLADGGLPAHLLELEITETAIMTDPVRVSRVLRHLQAMGVRVAIDDFGVGYTSLAHLKSLPVDVLKIDRHFISEMLHSEKDQAIVESVISLGHRLGFTVLAEGVENQAVADRLTSLGCDEGQGYHLGRPMPCDRLDDWLNKRLTGATVADRVT